MPLHVAGLPCDRFTPLLAVLLAVTSAIDGATSSPLYALDSTWMPEFSPGSHTFSAVGVIKPTESPVSNAVVYVTQRGNASVAPVLMLDAGAGLGVDGGGQLIGSWGANDIAIDRSRPPAATWGAHGLSIEACNYPCVTGGAGGTNVYSRVYVEDFTNHTVTCFTSTGQRLFQLGTPGVAGNGTDPVQFGNVADAAIEPAARTSAGPGPSYGPAHLYASDGDGGTANRVVKIKVPESGKPSVEWATPSRFDNPHSIALHERSGLLVVADREHNATVLLDAATGADLGIWDCGLDFGPDGRPFGVRTLVHEGRDLVLIASMDNPQDHRNQRISILDSSSLNAADGAKSRCQVVQQIAVPPSEYSGPHLLGVDASSGDIYAALVADAPRSTVLRYRLAGWGEAGRG